MLADKPEFAEVVDVAGMTPLHNAVMFDHKEIVELLISRGADVDAKNRKGQTPLLFAMRLDSKEIAELLISERRGRELKFKWLATSPLCGE